jgi:hypothetical protein
MRAARRVTAFLERFFPRLSRALNCVNTLLFLH